MRGCLFSLSILLVFHAIHSLFHLLRFSSVLLWLYVLLKLLYRKTNNHDFYFNCLLYHELEILICITLPSTFFSKWYWNIFRCEISIIYVQPNCYVYSSVFYEIYFFVSYFIYQSIYFVYIFDPFTCLLFICLFFCF